MNSKKNRKIKKLSRIHIWPSILFLIISLLMTAFAFLTFVAAMLTNQMGERVNYAYANAVNVIRSFDAISENEQAVIDNLQSNAIASDAIFVFDADGNITASCGEPTYNENTAIASETVSEVFDVLFISNGSDISYTCYPDTDMQKNLMDELGNIRFDRLMLPEYISVFSEEDDESNKEALFEAKMWLGSELSGGRRILVKCAAPLYRNDFIKSVSFGFLAACIMVFPTIFFFINVLFSIRSQHRTTRLLYTDTVTGGSNYIYFQHNAEKLLNKRGPGRQLMVVDVTIQKYRNYCNFHGNRAGEELLEYVDREIKAHLKKKEICAHSGKASFALLLSCSGREQGKSRVEALVQELSSKYGKCGIVFHAGIIFSEDAKSLEGKVLEPGDCLSRASAARASLTDENVPAAAVYDDKLLEEQRWVHKVEEKMQTALEKEEFQVYLQPKYDPVTNKLAGAEALIRWVNDEDGFISPGRFIPIFENNGFITKIDDYMISHVAKLQADWLAQGKTLVPVSVNVSRAHFANPDLAEHICSLVDAYHLPHHLIEIELTESAFFDDKAALLRTVHQLRSLGFEISMDDFGAGYSSLNSLKDLPLDVLKLDAEFFRGGDEENRGEIVISQAIQLAKSLNMRIVAEGVEKKEQVDFLAGQGCDMIQGFYFAKPMPVDEYEKKLEQ